MRQLKTILFLILSLSCLSQQQVLDDDDNVNSSSLEDLAESEDAESENDYDLQQLEYYKRHPLDINGEDISTLPLLDPLHVVNLKTYRTLLGDIIDMHELQAVPGFTVELIKRIIPFITLKRENLSGGTFERRLKGGQRSLLIRNSFVPERAEGFKTGTGQFTGSRPAIFSRYRYRYGNNFHYGILIDKDAGEKLSSGNTRLPDFVSFHLFSRHTGLVRKIAIGDYTINYGQGLIHWQSQAFKKSSAVMAIKRQGETLRPYQSAGEYNFHRGAAIVLAIKGWEGTVFLSFRRLSANTSADSSLGYVVTSVLASGLHRTASEIQDKNSLTLYSAGASMRKQLRHGHVGFNGVTYSYSLPLAKKAEPYNVYTIKGAHWANVSLDYAYTFRNVHLFGEGALDRKYRIAYINGIMASLGSKADIAILYRTIHKGYQSIYGNAFTEGTMPTNEVGLYTGFSFKPTSRWKVDLYSDLFQHPWLRYRVDAPSGGFNYLVQLAYKPNKKVHFVSRYRYRMKPVNLSPTERDDHWPVPEHIYLQNWRTQVNYEISKTVLLRTRVEWCFARKRDANQSPGYLFFTDLIFKPPISWLSGNLRFQSFESETYDSRIFAYENDVLYASATPAFYNNGVRYYINLKGDFKVKTLGFRCLTVSFKAATTVYHNLENVGSGSSLIRNNRVSIVKLQLFLTD